MELTQDQLEEIRRRCKNRDITGYSRKPSDMLSRRFQNKGLVVRTKSAYYPSMT